MLRMAWSPGGREGGADDTHAFGGGSTRTPAMGTSGRPAWGGDPGNLPVAMGTLVASLRAHRESSRGC